MKILQIVLLIAALVGLGFNAPAWAAKKAQPAANKKHVKAKSGKTAKTAAKAAKPGKTAKPGQRSKVASGKPHKVSAKKKHVHKVVFENFEPGKLALYSASAYVVDQTTGEVLVDKNSTTVLPIASISKLMTAMVMLDAKQDMQEVIGVDDEDVDARKGTRSRLSVGTTMTRETALLLALMSSENRAAHAIGRNYPGGLVAFVAAMNQKAAALGMTQTHFEEPTGLSSNNVSTARDLAKMVAAAANYPAIRQASTTAEARLDVNGRIQVFGNTNSLVKSDTWEIGVSKTGFISEAGRCLVMQAKVATRPVVMVLLDSNGKMTRVGDANRIKRWMESA